MTDPRLTDDALDRLRMVGDEPADALARALLTAYGTNGYDETQVLRRAMRAVTNGTASRDDSVLAWLSEGPALPAWADAELIAQGQRFFRSWPLPIATTLFCSALPTAFAAPHGAAVLMATSGLMQRRFLAARLAATGQMLFDVMDFASRAEGALHPGSQGYRTARGVRLLHGLVRQDLLSRTDEPWPAERGIPVNQEDLLGTLFTFTVSVLDGLERLGVPVADADAQGYMHAWCVVGALLGIDETLLPLTPDEARALGLAIARRQLGPSRAGTVLARELLREMRLAMPTGCEDLPAALVHWLVPGIAEILQVPRPGPVWRRTVPAVCALGRRRPQLMKLASGPAALVGRSMLRMYVDRAQQPGGPSYRIDAGVLRLATGGDGPRGAEKRTDRRRRRGDVVGVGPHVGPSAGKALAALAHPIDLPIDAEDVRLVASQGYPMWESVDVMVRRNRRITLAYADLSHQLRTILTGDDGVVDANWCTFATWSSKTIGTFIADIPSTEDGDSAVIVAGPERPERPEAKGPDPLARALEQLTLKVMTRSHAAGFRTLAAGNRAVFLEMGLALATFVDRFPERAAALGQAGELRWQAYWTTIEAQLREFAALDPSWLLTPCPPAEELRLGLREYLDALRTDDPQLRSQHVLAGNLLFAAYEQRRVDGYVWAALALFTEHAMRRLIRDRTGAVGGFRSWPSGLFAQLMTRRMTLELPHEMVWLGRPIPPPPNPDDRWHDLTTDADVTLPILQALITRYHLAVGRRPNRGARNWTSFDQRMRTVGNLFRFRQRQSDLFDDPFTPAETALLLAGGTGIAPAPHPSPNPIHAAAP